MDLASLLRPGCRVAVGDGFGRPRALLGKLSDAAKAVGDVRLLLGWMPHTDVGLRLGAFSDVRTVMSGWGLRGATYVQLDGVDEATLKNALLSAWRSTAPKRLVSR